MELSQYLIPGLVFAAAASGASLVWGWRAFWGAAGRTGWPVPKWLASPYLANTKITALSYGAAILLLESTQFFSPGELNEALLPSTDRYQVVVTWLGRLSLQCLVLAFVGISTGLITFQIRVFMDKHRAKELERTPSAHHA